MTREAVTNSESFEAVYDRDGSHWDTRSKEWIARGAHIIALRGAGSINGISHEDADKILSTQLLPRIQSLLQASEVVVMYDGDPDVPEKPDIGYIMGRLRSSLGPVFKGKISFVAVQKDSWYRPKKHNGALENSEGQQYETYVFPDNTFDGDHNSFTQSNLLANYERYEQWYIGACGPIASKQLPDLNNKVSNGKRNITIFRAKINESLTVALETELKRAVDSGDKEEAEVIKKKIEQRKSLFGQLFSNTGDLIAEVRALKNLNISVVG